MKTEKKLMKLTKKFDESRAKFNHSKPKYNDELKKSALKLIDEGISPSTLSSTLGIHPVTLNKWKRKLKKEISNKPVTDKNEIKLFNQVKIPSMPILGSSIFTIETPRGIKIKCNDCQSIAPLIIALEGWT